MRTLTTLPDAAPVPVVAALAAGAIPVLVALAQRGLARDRVRAGRRGPDRTDRPAPAWFAARWSAHGVTPPDFAWPLAAGGAGIAAVLVAVAPMLGIGVAALVVAAVVAVPRWLAARRERRRRSQLPAALDTVAASLRAGRSLSEAVGDAGGVGPPLGGEFASIATATRRGEPLPEALARWARAHPDPDTRAVAAALAVGSTVGGPVARAIDGAAASLRDRQALEREAAALASQSKTTAVVLSVAPILLVALLGGVDGDTRTFLTTSFPGQVMLAIGLGLDVAGAVWSRRIVVRAIDPAGASS